jgi:trk system potassium uptake protein TrkA
MTSREPIHPRAIKGRAASRQWPAPSQVRSLALAGPGRAPGAKVERTIAGAWSGRPLSELEEPGRVRVAAVGRLGVAQIPRADLVVQDGDVLYLTVASDAVDAVDGVLAAGPAKGRH